MYKIFQGNNFVFPSIYLFIVSFNINEFLIYLHIVLFPQFVL